MATEPSFWEASNPFLWLDGGFIEIEKYIAEGLPENHFSRDWYDDLQSDSDDEPEENTYGGEGSKKRKATAESKKKSKKPVKDKRIWFDTDSSKYKDYPPAVLYSARFRDGLTSDETVYPSFWNDFKYTCWSGYFFSHSRVVFDHLYASQGGEVPAPCPSGTHVLRSAGELVSGHKMGTCASVIPRVSFLRYCLHNIEGFQSQTLMRGKLFQIIDEEAKNLPKGHRKSASEPKLQAKWMHSLQIVISELNFGKDPWLDFKFYGEEDVDYLFEELLPRVNQAFLHLKAQNAFDSEAGSEILCCLLYKMHSIEEQYSNISDYCDSEARKTLFAKLIKKYTPLLEECYERHHAAGAKKLDLIFVKAADKKKKKEEEEEEEGEEEKEEEEEEEEEEE